MDYHQTPLTGMDERGRRFDSKNEYWWYQELDAHGIPFTVRPNCKRYVVPIAFDAMLHTEAYGDIMASLKPHTHNLGHILTGRECNAQDRNVHEWLDITKEPMLLFQRSGNPETGVALRIFHISAVDEQEFTAYIDSPKAQVLSGRYIRAVRIQGYQGLKRCQQVQ